MSPSVFDRSVVPAIRDLGDGFQVRRALPSTECRAVGPFVFFDQFGPTTFRSGTGLDVRPHPHIGLATVTYLFDGEIMHRDSVGNAQVIRPEEVNWMIAGRGIVHSERTAVAARSDASTLAGIQSWVALPQQEEQRPASFTHHAAAELPLIENGGRRIRIIAGTLFGAQAAVATLSPMGYADAQLESGAELQFGDEFDQCAIYVVRGAITAGGQRFGAAQLLLPRTRERVRMHAQEAARLMLLAGAPLDGPRYVWWNFVSSSRDRIEQAKRDWHEGRFGTVPGDAQEFIPLPEETAPAAGPVTPPPGTIL